MSDVQTTETVPQAVPAAKSSTGSATKPKKTSKMTTKARSMFDASAGSMSTERFFSEFTELRRNNVDIILDPTLQDRLAEPYVTRAADHADYKLRQPTDKPDLQVLTHALVSLTMARKLMMATPQSDSFELGRFRALLDQDLFAPKSLIAAVDNLGKFEVDDYVARIKYSGQDILRSLLRMCQVMSRHSRFKNMYSSPVQGVKWKDLDIDTVVFTSESSVRWMRDKAAEYLDNAYKKTWKVAFKGEDGEHYSYEASYPRLEISKNVDVQYRNVLKWLEKLHPQLPAVDTVVAAGLATCWKLLWFQRVGSLFSHLEPDVPDWLTSRPVDFLDQLNLHHLEIQSDDYDGYSYVGMIKEVHRLVISSVPIFVDFLDVARQPENKFGSEAMMLPYDPEDLVERKMPGLDDESYFTMRSNIHTTTISKIKNKSRVVAGLIFGFSKDVQVRNNYVARVNGDPNTIRSQFFKPDYKH